MCGDGTSLMVRWGCAGQGVPATPRGHPNALPTKQKNVTHQPTHRQPPTPTQSTLYITNLLNIQVIDLNVTIKGLNCNRK